MQFTGESINELTEFGIRLIDRSMPDERPCRNPFCRWHSATMEHYISDHAQMDEIFREEQRHGDNSPEFDIVCGDNCAHRRLQKFLDYLRNTQA